ncbi:MAG: phosphate/phosphite/phosphonate ABC transporter substrate-binding protein [Gammaproteobacteria bacterium]|nr:phosphate/phosphite/phosphonate ABC transporter substrate-binding protein [Gammaproteobacteria bacterium]
MFLKVVLVLCLLFGIEKSVVAKNKNDYVVAVRAHVSEQRAIKKWGPTIEWLNQTIPGSNFTLKPYTSLKQQIADAREKRFDFLLTNPATYVELEAAVAAQALLTLVNNRVGTAQTRFGSVIFTHIDNTDILTLSDLKGRSFVGVNPIGFGGWRVGLLEMKNQGIYPEKDFSDLQFSGNQPDTVYAVLNKKFDAGIVRTDMLERLASKGKIDLNHFRVLNPQQHADFPFFCSSALYPEWPFAVMPHVDKNLTNLVTASLLKITKEDKAAITGKYMGWTRALSYEPVKNLLKTLELGPYKNSGLMTTKNTNLLIAGIVLFIGLLSLYLYLRPKRE